jgi:tRNA pseudouridine55 synthase
LPPDGVLIVNKPRGLTSWQVVARVQRSTGASKAGHAGTLDPLATGVLVVCLGRATLLTAYLGGGTKKYRVEALLGVETDTYDAEGDVTARQDASSVGLTEIEAALPRLVGTRLQVPPAYSAVKRDGRRLYEYARKGEKVPDAERTVRIDSIEIASLEHTEDGPVAAMDVVCGPGTYIRSLVHDLGESLGTGACVTALERTVSGDFILESAVTLEDIAERGFAHSLVTLEEATSSMPTAVTDAEVSTAVTMGKPIPEGTEGLPEVGTVFRVMDPSGRMIAIYGPPREDDEGIAARAVRVLRPYEQGNDDEAA